MLRNVNQPASLFAAAALLVQLGGLVDDELLAAVKGLSSLDAEMFADPPKRYRPWTVWWWFAGSAPAADLFDELIAMDTAGLGGAEIVPVYRLMTAKSATVGLYSSSWKQCFTAVLRETEKRKFSLVLRFGSGWPIGGPWVRPSDSLKTISFGSFAANGPRRLSMPFPAPRKKKEWAVDRLECIVAVSGVKKRRVIAIAKDRRFRWNVLAG